MPCTIKLVVRTRHQHALMPRLYLYTLAYMLGLFHTPDGIICRPGRSSALPVSWLLPP